MPFTIQARVWAARGSVSRDWCARSRIARYRSGVVWVIVFGSIGLAGAIMLICYAVWLAHKTSDLFSELEMLAVRADELARLLSQIKVPERVYVADLRSDRTISAQIDGAYPT